MLIYNYKKEFLGIDEADLKLLSLSSVEELQEEATDFANLFVKLPGFIHNFKHVHWIDYITCNDEGVDSKAIIKVKNKNYSTNIQIRTIYLLQDPTQKAFIIELINLKSLSLAQEEKITASSSIEKELQTNINKPKIQKEESIYENLSSKIIKDPYEDDTNEISYNTFIKPDNTKIEIKEPLLKPDTITNSKTISKDEPLLAELKHKDKDESPFSNYSYDPHIASEELGLPIDLVEEFIQDFIAQANSFKSDLYSSLSQGDMNNLKIKSHKLKGVAANLRIEDALDALTIANSAHDEYEIQKNLDRFYHIINKLSKNSTQKTAPLELHEKKEVKEEVKDDFIISFKDELPIKDSINILDSDVPDSIEITELADDDFLVQSTTLKISDSMITDDKLINIDEPQEEALKVTLHYDKNKIAHDIGLDIDSFNELFNDYLLEVKWISTDMSKAIEKNDLNECKNSVKKLKSMSENMRVHEFDSYIEAIINTTDIYEIQQNIKNIFSILELLSKNKG